MLLIIPEPPLALDVLNYHYTDWLSIRCISEDLNSHHLQPTSKVKGMNNFISVQFKTLSNAAQKVCNEDGELSSEHSGEVMKTGTASVSPRKRKLVFPLYNLDIQFLFYRQNSRRRIQHASPPR